MEKALRLRKIISESTDKRIRPTVANKGFLRCWREQESLAHLFKHLKVDKHESKTNKVTKRKHSMYPKGDRYSSRTSLLDPFSCQILDFNFLINQPKIRFKKEEHVHQPKLVLPFTPGRRKQIG
jgi:hypothetical protein